MDLKAVSQEVFTLYEANKFQAAIIEVNKHVQPINSFDQTYPGYQNYSPDHLYLLRQRAYAFFRLAEKGQFDREMITEYYQHAVWNYMAYLNNAVDPCEEALQSLLTYEGLYIGYLKSENKFDQMIYVVNELVTFLLRLQDSFSFGAKIIQEFRKNIRASMTDFPDAVKKSLEELDKTLFFIFVEGYVDNEEIHKKLVYRQALHKFLNFQLQTLPENLRNDIIYKLIVHFSAKIDDLAPSCCKINVNDGVVIFKSSHFRQLCKAIAKQGELSEVSASQLTELLSPFLQPVKQPKTIAAEKKSGKAGDATSSGAIDTQESRALLSNVQTEIKAVDDIFYRHNDVRSNNEFHNRFSPIKQKYQDVTSDKLRDKSALAQSELDLQNLKMLRRDMLKFLDELVDKQKIDKLVKLIRALMQDIEQKLLQVRSAVQLKHLSAHTVSFTHLQRKYHDAALRIEEAEGKRDLVVLQDIDAELTAYLQKNDLKKEQAQKECKQPNSGDAFKDSADANEAAEVKNSDKAKGRAVLEVKAPQETVLQAEKRRKNFSSSLITTLKRRKEIRQLKEVYLRLQHEQQQTLWMEQQLNAFTSFFHEVMLLYKQSQVLSEQSQHATKAYLLACVEAERANIRLEYAVAYQNAVEEKVFELETAIDQMRAGIRRTLVDREKKQETEDMSVEFSSLVREVDKYREDPEELAEVKQGSSVFDEPLAVAASRSAVLDKWINESRAGSTRSIGLFLFREDPIAKPPCLPAMETASPPKSAQVEPAEALADISASPAEMKHAAALQLPQTPLLPLRESALLAIPMQYHSAVHSTAALQQLIWLQMAQVMTVRYPAQAQQQAMPQQMVLVPFAAQPTYDRRHHPAAAVPFIDHHGALRYSYPAAPAASRQGNISGYRELIWRKKPQHGAVMLSPRNPQSGTKQFPLRGNPGSGTKQFPLPGTPRSGTKQFPLPGTPGRGLG